jgi:hypothetical protein
MLVPKMGYDKTAVSQATGAPAPPREVTSTPQKACQSCRAAKAKCVIMEDTVDTDSPQCHRCAGTNQACTFGFVVKRRPRRRTDMRVAELEKELRRMKTAMASGRGSHSTTTTRTAGPKGGAPSRSPNATRASRHAEPLCASGADCGLTATPWHHPNLGQAVHDDVIDHGILSFEFADHLVHTYRTHQYPQWPFVPIHPDVTTSQLRATRPILFLSVLAAAATGADPSLFRALSAQLLHKFGEAVLVRSQKTLELVQAMLLLAVWDFPPDCFKHLNHAQYMHLAVTMAMDLGLGEQQNSFLNEATAAFGPGGLSEWDIQERERTLLGCYILSSG